MLRIKNLLLRNIPKVFNVNMIRRTFTSNLTRSADDPNSNHKVSISNEEESSSSIKHITKNWNSRKSFDTFSEIDENVEEYTPNDEIDDYLTNESEKVLTKTERNFKTLVLQTQEAITRLLRYTPDFIEKCCVVYVENVLPNQVQKCEELIQTKLKKPKGEAKMIVNYLTIIYEFLDRGMKGFLTGDLSYHLILNSKDIIDKYMREILVIENELDNLGIDPDKYYDCFFRIDLKSFYKNNPTKHLVMNLAKHMENSEGNTKSKLLYNVNFQTIFFSIKPNGSIKIKKKSNSDIDEKQVKRDLNEIKSKLQTKFNDMYNDILDNCIPNKLRTPFHGLLYPHLENKQNFFRRQLYIEEGSFERANDHFIKVFNDMQKIDKAHEMFFNRKMIINWHESLSRAIAEYQKEVTVNQSWKTKSRQYLKYIIALPSSEISILCLLHVLRLIINNMEIKKEDKITKTKRLLKLVRQQESPDEEFEIEIPLVSFAEDLGTLFFTELRNTKIDHVFSNPNAKAYFKALSSNLFQYEVSKSDKVKIGVYLTNILVNNIWFDKWDSYRKSGTIPSKILKIVQKTIDDGKKQNFIAIDKDFVSEYYDVIQRSYSLNIQIQKSLPMIYPPMNWKNFKIGSHFLRQTHLSKIVSDNYEASSLFEKTDVSHIMKCLDTLGKVKWKINNKTLDLVEYTWANGGGKAFVPQRFNDREVTKEQINETKDMKEKLKLLRESQTNRELHSLRSDFNIKLQIAKDFKKCNEIYFPHNIDYRGRAYPITPHFNHLGSDLCRGLLEYAEAKPLGSNGLKWLKVHLANVIGKDKLPLDQREAYIDSIMSTVHKCAKDPYRNQEWLESENPWQTISTMIEVSNAVKSSQPENYRTHLPVHVDGSCNGLQHYSALGRDFKGGYEVNLINRDRPGDVYSKVLEIVLEKIKTESNPNDIKYAEMLRGDIVNRKVIKQTVMTSVYGVTLIGARDQIKKQLNEKKIFDPQTLFYVSMYLAKKTIESIGDLFREANQIKGWLTKCALIIAHGGNTVKWITPLGLPCVQPYKKLSQVDLIRTHAQGVVVISDYDSQPVNKKKQGSAFPPNFIHSLDSTHMMQTCLRSADNGITFASVHDSFWSHPSDIDLLNRYIREEFVNLYSQPILEKLLNDFKSSFPELKFPDIPDRGNLNLHEVLHSTYFFS